ncbi:DUF2621 family protein [Allobacillus sp. SKP2-8]|uniref:DUF2621 family protein n=1 Tax=unclassified Allobacillus TaxID=2628859 RepID=UPI001182E569|nr:DUF2621 family protein [Allobacillus sp. SKP2-8]TSJ69132.1 DUF2621 family protein [Allobacillus sp. SKP2-8]
MLDTFIALLIIGWTTLMVVLMGIGGFFMFRKFLKKMPKADGKSIIDWEEYYIDESLHMWDDDSKKLLNELVEPVPQLFRDVAKQKIAAKIAELALARRKEKITLDVMIEGYIKATPKRDHKFLVKTLNEKNIDFNRYEHLLEL